MTTCTNPKDFETNGELQAAMNTAYHLGDTICLELLEYWLSGKGGTQRLTNSAADSYFDQTDVSSAVKAEVTTLMKNAQPGTKQVSPWRIIGNGDSGIDVWPPDNCPESGPDWHYGLNRADYRVAAYESASGKISYSVEMMKYYSFDKDFGGVSENSSTRWSPMAGRRTTMSSE